jgi:hypothetical protein
MIPSQPAFVLSPLHTAWVAEKNHIPILLVFGLTRLGLYHTRDKHANYYTIDAVEFMLKNE